MVTVDAARRFRLSSSLSRDAGFHPGQELAVVASSKNTFQLISGRRVAKKSNAPRYSCRVFFGNHVRCDWHAYVAIQRQEQRVALTDFARPSVTSL